MAFVIAGDIHGTLDIDKLIRYFDNTEIEYTKEDYLILAGDVGVCGFSPIDEADTRSVLRNLPVTVLFIDGNHENFQQLDSYPIDIWNGGKVHILEDDIIHLMRGQYFEIEGTSFFTFGGAYSIDRDSRVEGVTWFPEEIPTEEEYDEGMNNLEKHDFQVNYILTHTGPAEVVAYMGYGEYSEEETELRRYLQHIADHVEFQAWYFGHFHEDAEIEDTFFCLFDEMIELP